MRLHKLFNHTKRSAWGYSKARPKNPCRKFYATLLVVPDNKKAEFKKLVGRGNYEWNSEMKAWFVNSAILTDHLLKELEKLGVEVKGNNDA